MFTKQGICLSTHSPACTSVILPDIDFDFLGFRNHQITQSVPRKSLGISRPLKRYLHISSSKYTDRYICSAHLTI